eukprot:Clim_evm84s147 gene=Clim_evmTU84s147
MSPSMSLIRQVASRAHPIATTARVGSSAFIVGQHRFYAIKHATSTPTSKAWEAAQNATIRNDWTREEIQEIYDSPLLDLMFSAQHVHRNFQNAREVQQCTLLSIKTGGCTEDCKYCPQSSRYDTGVKAERLMKIDDVLVAARRAKEAGSTRFCMGAAWRDILNRKTNFKQVADMVKEIRAMDIEVCCTLGMLSAEQAQMLKEAGLTAYNHNLDTSREFYPEIISTRTYDDRLQTLDNVRKAGLSVCCGGIIGMGETEKDRVGLLHSLSTLPEHPESVPVNSLVPVKGTPLGERSPVHIFEMVRMIGTARIVMPGSIVRLSAGRVNLSIPEQAMCFFSGANSIFTGEKLLTTQNNDWDQDKAMFDMLGLVGKAPNFEQGNEPAQEAAVGK